MSQSSARQPEVSAITYESSAMIIHLSALLTTPSAAIVKSSAGLRLSESTRRDRHVERNDGECNTMQTHGSHLKPHIQWENGNRLASYELSGIRLCSKYERYTAIRPVTTGNHFNNVYTHLLLQPWRHRRTENKQQEKQAEQVNTSRQTPQSEPSAEPRDQNRDPQTRF